MEEILTKLWIFIFIFSDQQRSNWLWVYEHKTHQYCKYTMWICVGIRYVSCLMYPDDGEGRLIWNVGGCLPDFKASHLKTLLLHSNRHTKTESRICAIDHYFIWQISCVIKNKIVYCCPSTIKCIGLLGRLHHGRVGSVALLMQDTFRNLCLQRGIKLLIVFRPLFNFFSFSGNWLLHLLFTNSVLTAKFADR